MSTNIAFLSGKGGSGKTTLALSIADLLSRCEIKTLLVDCDLSTNGATYFYESRLSNNTSKTLSFDILLRNSDNHICENNLTPIEINPNLDFIPSVSSITNQIPITSISDRNDNMSQYLDELLSGKNNYDVILFDCQAGYTDILHKLLPNMDVDLFVLETDSISASAMRSLHLKIGNDLGRAKPYQVFNKATPEEFEIYSKIVGTFFTNIGTLLYDWKIRQAFSLSLVPDLENTSAQYGADLCNICKILFPYPEINKKLSSFSTKLEIYSLNESKKRIIAEIDNESQFNNVRQSETLVSIMISLLAFCGVEIVEYFYSQYNAGSNSVFYGYTGISIVSVIVLIGCFVSFFTLISQLGFFKTELKTTHEKEIQIVELNKKIKQLQGSLLSEYVEENTNIDISHE